MALALALVHHLAITQRQTFERIVLALADYADKWLLTEFVPLDDPRSRELLATHRRDMSWYTLDGFIAMLSQVFGKVEGQQAGLLDGITLGLELSGAAKGSGCAPRTA
jgi:hypothetical protein